MWKGRAGSGPANLTHNHEGPDKPRYDLQVTRTDAKDQMYRGRARRKTQTCACDAGMLAAFKTLAQVLQASGISEATYRRCAPEIWVLISLNQSATSTRPLPAPDLTATPHEPYAAETAARSATD